MKIELRQTIENEKLDEPKVSNTLLEGVSVNAILKKVKLDGKQICDLKNYGKTQFIDEFGSLFTIELTEIK